MAHTTTGAQAMALTDLSHLNPGDELTLADGRHVIVVRVVDATGELGGLVDTKALDGTYRRSAGFEAGRNIAAVNGTPTAGAPALAPAAFALLALERCKRIDPVLDRRGRTCANDGIPLIEVRGGFRHDADTVRSIREQAAAGWPAR